MRLKAGALWKCTNRECSSEIAVALGAKMEGAANPRCCCGSVMKRPFARPVVMKITAPADVERIRRMLEQAEEWYVSWNWAQGQYPWLLKVLALPHITPCRAMRVSRELLFTSVVAFLGAGTYLIHGALARPLAAESASVIAGAVFCALALVGIYFLWKPAGR